ncbi:MAG: pyruvate kinase alpha/beta domain-containing protein [Clostridiaceae bacterium]
MYFKNSGKENTEKTVELALAVAKERGINHIIIPACEGDTALLFKNCGLNVIVVTHVNGFTTPGIQDMKEDRKQELEGYGFKLYTSTHVLSGAERALSKKFGGVSPIEIIAHTLRMFGQGVKVAVEVTTMALDGGLIPYGKDIIALGGTERGVDTAIIIRPSHSSSILETKVKEIICKPV